MNEMKQNVPKLTVADVFTVSDGMLAEDLAIIAEYLGHFASPKNAKGKLACINCDAEIDGLKHALGVGEAYRWRITHGEAQCTGCGWPARGMHYVKRADGTEIFTLRNMFLPYRPSEVTDSRATAS